MTEHIAALVTSIENQIPFNRHLGLEGFDVDETGVAHVRLPMREELIGHPIRRALHGGVISATLDLVGGLAALFGVAKKVPEDEDEGHKRFAGLGTIDMRVDYLRPGKGEWFEASATVLRAGKRVVVTRMEMTDDEGRVIAVGTGTYIIN